MSGYEEHDNRVLGGYKATIHNPNTSTEAKKHAQEVLNEAGVTDAPIRQPGTGAGYDVEQTQGEEHTHRVLGGYKATLSNPNTSEEAKEHAREVLENADDSARAERDLHTTRVLAGHKAALNNPRVGEEAKDRARDVLREHGEL